MKKGKGYSVSLYGINKNMIISSVFYTRYLHLSIGYLCFGRV